MLLVILQIIIILNIIILCTVCESLTTLKCDNDNDIDCIIDCNKQNCESSLIDASTSNSLKLHCISNINNYTCQHSLILCPINGECNIECTTFDICKHLNIKLTYTNYNKLTDIDDMHSNIYLKCEQYSCSYITMNVSYANLVDIKTSGLNCMFLLICTFYVQYAYLSIF